MGGLQRAGSRQRTPMEPSFSDIKPSAGALDGLGLEGNHATKNGTGNMGANGLDFKLPAEDQIRFLGVQQEIPHFGAPPKRTESLYMKPGEAAQPQLKALGSSAMQRKKSLPDVATLPTVTVKGQPGHDKGGDLSALVCASGRDSSPAGRGGEISSQPSPLHLQPSHTGMVFPAAVDDGGSLRECDVSHYVLQVVDVSEDNQQRSCVLQLTIQIRSPSSSSFPPKS